MYETQPVYETVTRWVTSDGHSFASQRECSSYIEQQVLATGTGPNYSVQTQQVQTGTRQVQVGTQQVQVSTRQVWVED